MLTDWWGSRVGGEGAVGNACGRALANTGARCILKQCNQLVDEGRTHFQATPTCSVKSSNDIADLQAHINSLCDNMTGFSF